MMSETEMEPTPSLKLMAEGMDLLDKKNVEMFEKCSDSLHSFLQEIARNRKLPTDLKILSTDHCGRSAIKWAVDLIFKENYAEIYFGQFDTGAKYPTDYVLHAWAKNKDGQIFQTRVLPSAHRLKPLIIIKIDANGADKNTVLGYLIKKLTELQRAAESTNLPIGKMFTYNKSGESVKSFTVRDDRDNREQNNQVTGD